MWWMAMMDKAKGQQEKAKGFTRKQKTAVYEPDQGLALSMSKPAADSSEGDTDFSDEERKKKRLKASY